ncbi:serine/threonine-protein kinase [Longispora urticae]
MAGSTVGGRYMLRAAVGSGGMGTVWRAYDQLLRRDVAIKEVLIPVNMAKTDRDVLIERTLREARAAAGLNHPAVVRMYDVVTDGGRPWLVMELLAARSVAEIVTEDGPLTARATAKIGLAMLGALEAAHAAGILHRDVKPANVLISGDGRCVLTDFGVARLTMESDLTTPGMVLGSPHYIAPERAMGQAFGPPSDLFSLGVTLYTAVEGGPPFDRGDPIETMHAVVQAQPEPPRNAGPLTAILHGLLEKDPRRRWDVARTRAALRELIDGPLSHRQPPPEETDPHAVLRMAPPPKPVYQQPDSVIGGRAMLAPGETPAQRHARMNAARPAPEAVEVATGAAPTVEPPEDQQTINLADRPPPPAWQQQQQHHGVPPQGHGGYPPPPGGGYPPANLPPGLALRPAAGRRFPGWVIPAGAAALVLVLLVVGAIALFSGDEPDKGKKPVASPSGPAFATTAYQDPRGFSLNVPTGWDKTGPATANPYYDFTEPGKTGRRIRVNVENATSSRRWAEVAAHGLQTRTDVCPSFIQLGLKDTTLSGLAAAELDYTCGTGDTLRRGLWRGVVKDGKVYHFYLTVPATRFTESLPIHEELVRSFKLGT